MDSLHGYPEVYLDERGESSRTLPTRKEKGREDSEELILSYSIPGRSRCGRLQFPSFLALANPCDLNVRSLIKTNVNVLPVGHWVSSNLESLDKQKEEFILFGESTVTSSNAIQQMIIELYIKRERDIYINIEGPVSIISIFPFWQYFYSISLCFHVNSSVCFFLVISTMGNEVSDNTVYCWSSSFLLMRLSLQCLCITSANESSVWTGMNNICRITARGDSEYYIYNCNPSFWPISFKNVSHSWESYSFLPLTQMYNTSSLPWEQLYSISLPYWLTNDHSNMVSNWNYLHVAITSNWLRLHEFIILTKEQESEGKTTMSLQWRFNQNQCICLVVKHCFGR